MGARLIDTESEKRLGDTKQEMGGSTWDTGRREGSVGVFLQTQTLKVFKMVQREHTTHLYAPVHNKETS